MEGNKEETGSHIQEMAQEVFCEGLQGTRRDVETCVKD